MKSNKSMFVFITMMLILLTTAVSIHAQADRGSRCQRLDTEFGHLYGSWRWLDSDTVSFGVWNGFPDDSMTKSLYAWYQYHLASGVLEQLKDNPFVQLNLAGTKLAAVQLKNVQAGLKGLYENIIISPDQDIIIYPRQDGNISDMWLVDTRYDTEMPLGIGLGYTEAFWSANEQKIVLTPLGSGANYLSPMQLITLVKSKSTVQRLDEIKPLSDILPPTKNYFLSGISPDGHYLLITPELANYETWVIDLNEQKGNRLGYLIYPETRVLWTSSSKFIGVSALGAIRYDIETGKQEVLAEASEIGIHEITLDMFGSNLLNDTFIAGGFSLSPDGHYLMAQGQQNTKRNIFVCKVY